MGTFPTASLFNKERIDMQHENGHLEPIKILWTGGWDSTFQLLRLLFLDKQPVEPYYLIDEERPSTGIELLTMKRIRQSINEMDDSSKKAKKQQSDIRSGLPALFYPPDSTTLKRGRWAFFRLVHAPIFVLLKGWC